jgi:hypothetical protein
MGHARLSPSSAKRWMSCPGSVVMSYGLPDPGSEHAREGTAAHFLAADCLTNDCHPSAHLGRWISVGDDGAAWSTPGVGYEVDVDMAGYVNHYVQEAMAQAKGAALVAVETAVPIDAYTGETGAQGTADLIVIRDEVLQIHDLKYGRGVQVQAEGNEQLMLYALGALELYGMSYDLDHVELWIHQPRVSTTPSRWVCSLEDLMVFAEEVMRAARRVQEATDAFIFGDPGTLFYPSEEACRWCRAKHFCPALTEMVHETTGVDFENLDEKEFLNVQGLPDLGTKLAAVPLIEEWCKAVRAAVESELLAGNEVSGWKLVEGRRGNRAWINTEEVEALLKEKFRLKTEEMYDLKLISPTTAEKLKNEKVIGPRQWLQVEKLITRADGKPSVAPEKDPRPALVIQAVKEDFEDLGEDLL